MTRNQIPGVGARLRRRVAREAGYGYGWLVDTGRALGLLPRIAAAGRHGRRIRGAGGAVVFFDPANDLVGVVLEVVTELTATLEPSAASSSASRT